MSVIQFRQGGEEEPEREAQGCALRIRITCRSGLAAALFLVANGMAAAVGVCGLILFAAGVLRALL